MRIRCSECGKDVSTEVPDETVVRGWIECPECIESSPERYEIIYDPQEGDLVTFAGVHVLSWMQEWGSPTVYFNKIYKSQ